MAVSGSTDYNPTREIVVRRAMRMVGVYAANSSPSAEELSDAHDTLNAMLKAWQVDGYLWLRSFAELSLVQGQNSYQIGAGTTDVCVYQNTVTNANRPLKIFGVTRKDSSGYEVPVTAISRSDYMSLTNKSNQGKVTQWYYDPQRELGVIYVWPTPDNSTDMLVLDMDRTINDMDSDLNNFDLPQEWIEVLSYGLATRLAPEYGIPLAERNLLHNELNVLLNAVLSYNRGTESTFFQVGY
jgi:hypothetical protein